MTDFLSKLENFLFDILGLVLPGFIFILLLVLPAYIIDLNSLPKSIVDNSIVLSALSIASRTIQRAWIEDPQLTIGLFLIAAYLVGHFVKVFSIIKYELLQIIFDKSLNKLVRSLMLGLLWIILWIPQRINKKFKSTAFYIWVSELAAPIINTINKVFVFKTPNYFLDNDSLRTICIQQINSKLGTNYPDNWYSLYKLSSIVNLQENVKSLAGHFLAKYNLYRSLAFNFLVSSVYFYIFFSAASECITPELSKIKNLILIISITLWFTFHYKYKRYWTLAGNENLVSLYYFLNKKQLQ